MTSVPFVSSSALAAGLPAAYEAASRQLGPIAHSLAGAELMTSARGLLGSSDVYARAAASAQCQGFLAALSCRPPLTPGSLAASWHSLSIRTEEIRRDDNDPMQMPAESFLHGVRLGLIPNMGQFNGAGIPHWDAFLRGAQHLYPDALNGQPPFIASVARAWARLAAQSRPSEDEAYQCRSFEMGEKCAELLNDHYQLGLHGQLPASRLKSSLHVRDIPGTLMAKGWLTGLIERLDAQDTDETSEAPRVLEKNRSSIISYSLNRGNLDYAHEAAWGLIDPKGLLWSVDRALDEIEGENKREGRTLRSKRNELLSKLLHSGRLKTSPEILREL